MQFVRNTDRTIAYQTLFRLYSIVFRTHVHARNNIIYIMHLFSAEVVMP